MATHSLVTLDTAVVEKMASVIPCQKPDVIMRHFGIGVNTWFKIRDGHAIRRSVAVRLTERLQRDKLI